MNTQCSVFSCAQTRTHTHTLPYAHTSTQLTHVYTPSLSNLLPFSSSFLIQIIPPPQFLFFLGCAYILDIPRTPKGGPSLSPSPILIINQFRGESFTIFPPIKPNPPKEFFLYFPNIFSLSFSFVLSFSISFTHLYSII